MALLARGSRPVPRSVGILEERDQHRPEQLHAATLKQLAAGADQDLLDPLVFPRLLGRHRDPAVDVEPVVTVVVVGLRRPTHVLPEPRQVVRHVLQGQEDRLVDQVTAEESGHHTGHRAPPLGPARAISPHRAVGRRERQLAGRFLGGDDPLDPAVPLRERQVLGPLEPLLPEPLARHAEQEREQVVRVAADQRAGHAQAVSSGRDELAARRRLPGRVALLLVQLVDDQVRERLGHLVRDEHRWRPALRLVGELPEGLLARTDTPALAVRFDDAAGGNLGQLLPVLRTIQAALLAVRLGDLAAELAVAGHQLRRARDVDRGAVLVDDRLPA